jgi:long-chain fatty acid transport protein
MGSAAANPFFIGRFDGLDSGPTDQSAFSTYWNPAAIAQEGGSAQIHLLLVDRQASFDRVAELNDVPPEWAHINAGKNTTGALGTVPGLAARYGFSAGDFTVGLGLAAFVDRAGTSHWKRNLGAPSEYPGAIDGPQRWSVLNSMLVVLSPAASLAVAHAPSGLSVGVTPIMNFVSLSTVKAINPDRSERVVDDAGRLAEGRIFLEDATDEQLTAVVGVRYEGLDNAVFGLTWHSGVDYALIGRGRLAFGVAEEAVVNALINLPVAQSVRFGVDLRLSPRWTLRPMVSWADWSVMERQGAINLANGESLMDLPREWADSWSGRVRLDCHANESVRFTVGAGYETGVTPSHAFDPGLSEADNWEASVGVSVALGAAYRLSTSFTWQQYADVTVTDSVNKPLTNGHYTDQRQYLTLDLEVTL